MGGNLDLSGIFSTEYRISNQVPVELALSALTLENKRVAEATLKMCPSRTEMGEFTLPNSDPSP